jgi:hypothetical protein
MSTVPQMRSLPVAFQPRPRKLFLSPVDEAKATIKRESYEALAKQYGKRHAEEFAEVCASVAVTMTTTKRARCEEDDNEGPSFNCDICGNSVSLRQYEDSGNQHCGCSTHKGRICRGHTLYCVHCDKPECTECIQLCVVCQADVCESCVNPPCPDCSAIVCVAVLCEDKHVCPRGKGK